MGYASGSSTRRPTRYRKRRSRRSSALKKVRYQRPSAYNQKKQIERVTRLALANRKRFNTCYTDYALTFDGSTPGIAMVLNAGTWLIQPLTDFATWLPIFRQDTNVNEASHSFVKRMKLDTHFFANGFVSLSVFILRMRRPEADRNLLSVPPDKAQGDFIDSGHPTISTDDIRVQMNPGKFKVIASKYLTINNVVYGTSNAAGADPMRRHCTFNLNPAIKVSEMSSATGVPRIWRNKNYMDLPYYNRLYLAVLPGFGPSTTGTTCQIQYNQIATCVNTL